MTPSPRALECNAYHVRNDENRRSGAFWHIANPPERLADAYAEEPEVLVPAWNIDFASAGRPAAAALRTPPGGSGAATPQGRYGVQQWPIGGHGPVPDERPALPMRGQAYVRNCTILRMTSLSLCTGAPQVRQ